MNEPPPLEPTEVQQVIHVESGYGYGCIGADIHIFGNGKPVYLLFEHRQITGIESQWLRGQPSRMLDARAKVVDFTGRDAELNELVAWRDADQRFAVRWLHGEGGQGKTRLADLLADQSKVAGWKVVDAIQGTDAHPPAAGSQDLRLNGCAGVLLLIDYADRWPLSDLTWLLHNRLLRQSIPTRVLLIGRSASGWPALRGKLNQFRENIDTSDQYLSRLPEVGGARELMFNVACKSFARHFPSVNDPLEISPPHSLTLPDFGLTLVVQMAALVAVDAMVHGRDQPSDVVGMTTYLLDRERENWHQLYENSERGLDFRTSEEMLARAVFTAILAGPVDRHVGTAVLDRIMPGGPSAKVLVDHAVCYPPTDPARSNTLEPLLPDRLAEDFVALMLPGSQVTGHPADNWTATVPAELLRRNEDGTAPAWAARTVIFLSAAASRWAHVGDGFLYPIMLADPRLALDGGSAALTALSRIREDHLPDDGLTEVLGAVDSVLPEGRHVELDTGIASVVERLTTRRLTETDDLGDQAVLYSQLSQRLDHAGMQDKAVESAEEAVRIARRLEAGDSDSHLVLLGGALVNLAAFLPSQRVGVRKLEIAEEAAGIFQKLARSDPDRHAPALSASLMNLGTELSKNGKSERGLRTVLEAASILMRLADSGPSQPVLQLAMAADNLGWIFSDLGRPQDALDAADSAISILRVLEETHPAVCEPDLARALDNRSSWLHQLGRSQEAIRAVEESISISRRLVRSNPEAFQSSLATALDHLGVYLIAEGRSEESVVLFEEASIIFRRLSEVDPDSHEPALARILGNLGAAFGRLGRLDEALPLLREVAEVRRRLSETDPAYLLEFALTLGDLATLLAAKGHPEAMSVVEESVTIREQLSSATSDTQLPALATTLHDLAGQLSRSGQRQEALLAIRCSVAVHRRLAEINAHDRSNFAMALVDMSALLSALGHDGALSASEEALTIWWELVEVDPASHLPNLAVSVNRTVSNLLEVEQLSKALALAEGVAATLKRLAATDPATFRPFIAKALAGLTRLRIAEGSNLARARIEAQESVALFLQLTSDEPQVYAKDLRDTLISYATVLAKTGRIADAEKILAIVNVAATMLEVYAALRSISDFDVL